MELVEKSGMKSVGGEVQQAGLDRKRDRPGQNNDRRSLLVWISSLSPDIILTSWCGLATIVLTASSTRFTWPLEIISWQYLLFILIALANKENLLHVN